VSDVQSLFHVLGPLTAFGVVGVLALVLRWAFGGRPTSLVERKVRQGRSNEYGLLVAVSAPGTLIEAEMQRLRLEESGIRTTLVTTVEGPRLMVFPEHERVARALLRS
jgi:hypothetical protein